MSFRQIPLQFPNCPGCEIVGFLYDSDDALELGEDMIEVRIPGGIIINAGWSPEGSPDGRYEIKTWGKLELPPICSKDVDDAAQMIRKLVGRLTSDEPTPISDSFTTVHRDRLYEVA